MDIEHWHSGYPQRSSLRGINCVSCNYIPGWWTSPSEFETNIELGIEIRCGISWMTKFTSGDTTQTIWLGRRCWQRRDMQLESQACFTVLITTHLPSHICLSCYLLRWTYVIQLIPPSDLYPQLICSNSTWGCFIHPQVYSCNWHSWFPSAWSLRINHCCQCVYIL